MAVQTKAGSKMPAKQQTAKQAGTKNLPASKGKAGGNKTARKSK